MSDSRWYDPMFIKESVKSNYYHVIKSGIISGRVRSLFIDHYSF